MSRLFYFILLNIGLLMLFTQCKDAPATEKITKQSAVEETAKEVAPVKEVAKIVDSAALVKEEIIATKPVEKAETTAKKVAAKTVKTADRKTEPKVVKQQEKKKKVKKRAKVKFDDLVHKFGTIKTGDKVSHQFKFKNTGNAPLVIKSVDVSCGCTFPSYPFLPIEPGKEGAIDVTFDSTNKLGRQKPTITVVTNGRPRTIKLNLEGFVE